MLPETYLLLVSTLPGSFTQFTLFDFLHSSMSWFDACLHLSVRYIYLNFSYLSFEMLAFLVCHLVSHYLDENVKI